MPEIPKYNGIIDPNEHDTSYTCAIKGNGLEDDEIVSVLLKKFEETLSKGAMIWYNNLPPKTIDSFAMLADSFVKSHARAIKIETRKSDLFKVRQKDNEMLREFVSRFQMEWMDLPPVADDWEVQAFSQGLNIQSSIRVQDDQLRAPSGSYPIRPGIKRDIDQEPRANKDLYQPYSGDRRSSEPGRNPARNERRGNRGQSSRALISKNDFKNPIGPKEELRLSEYNFNVDADAIISAIERIKDTRWPRPLHVDLARRDTNQMSECHGTHGHRIEDCRKLREEVARLLTTGIFRSFLAIKPRIISEIGIPINKTSEKRLST
ncbi:PREDICTED: uncharacterized protein LOC109239273 [Nicotiana attenuata]|uniref:uncharacterized protein LOC109239273 n=1 Tax=Nicotiana attenuata TaxID=49451 RepID=UPI0009058E71|nr:PREDICTED: uncharacterized protein LOC109239273 [Nicotiana attenuata]